MITIPNISYSSVKPYVEITSIRNSKIIYSGNDEEVESGFVNPIKMLSLQSQKEIIRKDQRWV